MLNFNSPPTWIVACNGTKPAEVRKSSGGKVD